MNKLGANLGRWGVRCRRSTVREVLHFDKSHSHFFSLCNWSFLNWLWSGFLPCSSKSHPKTPFKPWSRMVTENQSENLRWRTFDRQPGKCCSKRQEDQKQFSQVNQIPPIVQWTFARKVLGRFSIRMSEREPEPPGPDGGWGWLVCLAAFYCVSILDGSASQYIF